MLHDDVCVMSYQEAVIEFVSAVARAHKVIVVNEGLQINVEINPAFALMEFCKNPFLYHTDDDRRLVIQLETKKIG
jgi:hypothetical protein